MKGIDSEAIRGSFRDPDGTVFSRDGILYRQVNASYRPHYEHLMKSGLYDELAKSGYMIAHSECDSVHPLANDAFKVLRPERVPFISFPYEWSFSQLKAAGLLTLEIQKVSLDFGMTLKDASAYNIQFLGSRPILIDTLSFEIYEEQRPWQAYRQFCQHFIAPLALAAYVDVRLIQLSRVYIDGVPLDLCAGLLPTSTMLRIPLLLHIHLHAKSQKYFAEREVNRTVLSGQSSVRQLRALTDNLYRSLIKLDWKPKNSEWADYYEGDSYGCEAYAHKRKIVGDFAEEAAPSIVWDLGANTGEFSRLVGAKANFTVAWDMDPACVELNYRNVKAHNESKVLPLVLDLSNPSPAIGWANEERPSFSQRGPVDLVMALALVHHLAISNNVPLPRVAEFLSRLCARVIVEFVPKTDPKVRRLLSTRKDVFPDYTVEGFEAAFQMFFTINNRAPIRDSDRVVYLMSNNARCPG